MSEFETLGILDEISSLVSDRLQVVSYKWLSRNFLVSSNAAKKLLQEFVEKSKDDLEVMYSVAGWLKKAPPTYHIRLVPQPKLTEAKQDFDGNCSVQVYSVQACIPKDPAAIWNAEFIQAEELFKQPITVDNCLRDNRFCGVSNSMVKRNAEGVPASITVPQTKGVRISGQACSSANQAGSFLQPQQKKLEQALALQSSSAIPKTDTDRIGTGDMQNKESDKNKTSLPSDKKGSSLANLWGRASSKPKSTISSVEEKFAGSMANDVPVSADALISACENSEPASSDEDEADVNFKRASNDGGKKRRVVLDDSDEEDYETAVSLGSPDIPNVKSSRDSKQRSKTSDIKNSILKFDEHDESKQKVKEEIPQKKVKEDIPQKIVKEEIPQKKKVKEEIPQKKMEEEKAIDDANHYAKEEFSALYMGKNVRVHGRTPDVDTSSKNKAAVVAPNSPKRRKVLKTRIDERGREVTEVVWEGEEVDTKDTYASKSGSENAKNSNGLAVQVEENGPANPANRTTTKKSPAVAPSHAAGKAGGKKGANSKDPKQGNILSFFKRV